MAVKTWGDFEIDFEVCLGRGGMGAVYKGRQISLDRPAAIKILKGDLTSNPEFVKRFSREAALLARIVDNHVVQIFGAGEAEGHHFYAMEFVEGEDYASKVKKGHKFTLDEVLAVGESVGIALQMAWKHRIIHRDIKPSNILLTKDNETKVMDFGLAKNPESDLTASEVIMGTAKYMSPEQATGGACDIRSDLYSLGVVLYELATGQPPFTGEGATAIMYQHVHKQPKPPREINPEIPVEVEKMILRLMAKDREARYPSPEALVAVIHDLQEGVTPEEHHTLYDATLRVEDKRPKTQVGGGPVTSTPASGTSMQPAGPGKLIAIVAAVAVALGVGGYFAFREKPTVPVVSRPVNNDPPTIKDPPPPPPPPPPVVISTKALWEEPLRKGNAAFSNLKWGEAIQCFEEAIRFLENAENPTAVAELNAKVLEAKSSQAFDIGDNEPDEEKALRHFEIARKFKDSETIRERIKKVSFGLNKKTAEKNEGSDWFKAADAWKRAVEAAPESEVEEARVRYKFCSTFAEAVSARTSKSWTRAQELYNELAKNPRGQAEVVEAALKLVDAEVLADKRKMEDQYRGEFKAHLDSVRDWMTKADWAKAKESCDKASDPKYKGLPQASLPQCKEEIQLALSPPPGMIYIPGGKFMMGGGRAVEGPAGEASTVAVYMDEREVRVSEYVEFVKALDSFGHTPACVKEEPPNKKHIPIDWEQQKPEDAVTGVDYWDAMSFASWRKKRLPRETEWERAASFDGENGHRLYPWGKQYKKEAGKSYLGLDGMGSGVLEWTVDWLQRYPWSKAEHPDFGEKRRVVRGGVVLLEDAPEGSKVTYRYWYLPMYRSRKVGFRCVQDMPEK